MARPLSPDHDAVRDRILGRAVHAFAEHGYASASMSELARACGTSKAGLYHYYPSKDRLLFDALDRYTRRLIDVCEAVPAQALSPRQALAELVRALLREYRNSHDQHVALLNDVKHLPEAERERIKAQQREVVRLFRAALTLAYPQRMSGPDATPTTMALLGMMNFSFAWLRPDGPMSYEAFADLVIELWERGLSGAPAAPLRIISSIRA